MKKETKKPLLFKVKEEMQLLPFLMKEFFGISRSKAKSMLTNHVVWVDDEMVSNPLFSLRVGQEVTVDRTRHKRSFYSRELSIVFEDPYLVVINKQCGLLSMSAATKQHTAQSILNGYLQQGRRGCHAHLVHRLDRDTSGLMLYAKDIQTQESLVNGWQDLVTDRRYVAVIEGSLSKEEGEIRSWLWDDKHFVTHSSPYDNGGKLAITHYRTLKTENGYSLVELHLETGRKNQIRVHLQTLGHPIVGDFKYGSGNDRLGRLGLHACRLCFQHPVTEEQMNFDTSLPDCFEKIMRKKEDEK